MIEITAISILFFSAFFTIPVLGIAKEVESTKQQIAMYGEEEFAYRKLIEKCINMANSNIIDFTGDGILNCQDAAVTFKKTFDREARRPDKAEYKMECEFVLNNNHDDFNHIFVRCRRGNLAWEYIEPRANSMDCYLMEDYWSPENYNPKLNTTEGTEYWLRFL